MQVMRIQKVERGAADANRHRCGPEPVMTRMTRMSIL